MKKTLTILCAIAIANLVTSQNLPSPINAERIIIPTQAQTKSYSQSNWIDYISSYGAYYGSSNNTFNINYIFPDSTIRLDYGTGTPFYSNIVSVAQVFDLNSEIFTTTGTSFDLNRSLTIDSIDITGIYERIDNAVVDTLVVNFTPPSLQNLNAQYYFAGSQMINNYGDTVFFQNLSYDYNSLSINGFTRTVKVPLDNNFYADSSNIGFHSAKIQLNEELSSLSNGLFAISLDFIPGYSWSSTDTLAKNKNSWKFLSNELNGQGTYQNYIRTDRNMSYLLTKETRYNINGGWNGSYIPSVAYPQYFPYESMAIKIKASQEQSVNITDCSELYFSKYIEGSGNNKALEIYNPTNTTLDLSNYEIRKYDNGNSTPITLALSGFLGADDVFVITNPTASFAAQADLTDGFISFNGDDAIELYNTQTATVIDLIGVVGVDPGSSWAVGNSSTKEFTLVRKPEVKTGGDIWTGLLDLQWIAYPQDDISNLGAHTNTGCYVPVVAIAHLDYDTICLGDSIKFSNVSTDGRGTQSVVWNFGNGNTSTDSTTSFTFSTTASHTISLTVTDGATVVDDTTVTIFVKEISQGYLSMIDTACVNESVVMAVSYDYASNNETVTFSDENGFLSNNDYNLYSSTVGSHQIVLLITNPSGCSFSDTNNILIQNIPTADFSYSGDPEVTFTDLSTSAINWAWSFDDGSTAPSQNPIHTYTNIGSYDVSLIVENTQGCSDTVIKTVTISQYVGIVNTSNQTTISIYPNPVNNGIISIESDIEINNINIFNMLGQTVYSSNKVNEKINLTQLNKGNYVIQLSTDKGVSTQELIIE